MNTQLLISVLLRRFFKQYLAFFNIHQMALSLFRFIAAVGRTPVASNTQGTFVLLLVFVLGGFIVAKGIHFQLELGSVPWSFKTFTLASFLAPRWTPMSEYSFKYLKLNRMYCVCFLQTTFFPGCSGPIMFLP